MAYGEGFKIEPFTELVREIEHAEFSYKETGLLFGFSSIKSCMYASHDIVIFKNYCSQRNNFPARGYTIISAKFGMIDIYEEKIVSLAAYPAGTQLYIAFVKSNTQSAGATTGDRWLIDDVKVVQQCLDPTILTVGAITPTTASLGWTNNGTATSWEVEVVPAASAPTGVGVPAPTNPFKGLAEGCLLPACAKWSAYPISLLTFAGKEHTSSLLLATQ